MRTAGTDLLPPMNRLPRRWPGPRGLCSGIGLFAAKCETDVSIVMTEQRTAEAKVGHRQYAYLIVLRTIQGLLHRSTGHIALIPFCQFDFLSLDPQEGLTLQHQSNKFMGMAMAQRAVYGRESECHDGNPHVHGAQMKPLNLLSWHNRVWRERWELLRYGCSVSSVQTRRMV